MASAPHSDRAILDVRKLEDDCLDPTHPRGRHKARVFKEVLDIDRSDASWLRETLLAAVRVRDAAALLTDRFGSRWAIDVPVTRQGKTAVVRTIWIVRTDEDALRFVTCWMV